MDSQELIELMGQIDSKGMDWDKITEQIKVSHDLLMLYANSGPVPVTIIKNLEKVLEGAS
jgi:hypothetical protein